jgi:hypothetical protein
MHQTSEAGVEFLVGHLRWCLAQPLNGGSREWAVSVSRAVNQLDEAFRRHVEVMESAGGPLEQVAEPGQLPFTSAAQQVRRLRREHATLHTEIQCVGELFRDCLLLFAPPPDPFPRSAATSGMAESRATRLFGMLGSRVEDFLAELENHLAAERELQAALVSDVSG